MLNLNMLSQEKFTHFDMLAMTEALSEAQKAFDKDEVPVGAVLAAEGQIIARAHNLVESKGDASAHAEKLCIQKGAHVLGGWRLYGATLYTTLEPCLMCAGALLLARVDRVVYGAKDLRHGAHGSFLNVFEKKHPTHTLLIEGGLREEEARWLMRAFFQKQRSRK